MSDIVCVTSRALCREDFFVRMERIAAARPGGVILREKELSEEAYRELAGRVLEICREHGTACVLHGFPGAARALGHGALHLPLPALRRLPEAERRSFSALGASCHSACEAREAERLGCTYVTAGHVFDTDCKRGLPGRGTAFLREVCECVSIPVYAIGGIRPERMEEVRRAGAAGACVMSGVMQCENVGEYLATFEEDADVSWRQTGF